MFHVFTHCVWAAPALYRDDLDRVVFLRELARVTNAFELRCVAFCLMKTHFHLILDVAEGALPTAMQSLNFRYAVHFNGRHGMRGHVQFARYGAVRIKNDSHLLTVFRYLARNPVEAQLCEDCADWPWSSYRSSVGLEEPPSFLDPGHVLRCFDLSPELAAAQLRTFVEKT